MKTALDSIIKGIISIGTYFVKGVRFILRMISKGIQLLFLGIVVFYRKFISPMHPPCCKYYPTCSQYALEAIKKYGPIKGTGMAIWRVLRCNPWSKGGYDPVK